MSNIHHLPDCCWPACNAALLAYAHTKISTKISTKGKGVLVHCRSPMVVTQVPNNACSAITVAFLQYCQHSSGIPVMAMFGLYDTRLVGNRVKTVAPTTV